MSAFQDLARAAADAVTQLSQTLLDCAREVEDRGGTSVARQMRSRDTEAAWVAVGRFCKAKIGAGSTDVAIDELIDIADGCRYGYVRGPWALRIMQMGAEASPVEVCRGCGEPAVMGDKPCPAWEEAGWSAPGGGTDQ